MRPVKTQLLAHMEVGCSQREAARREGLPESTARGILRNPEIVPIVANLHSRRTVPRVTDRHHAARQSSLTPKRVAALHSLYLEPREERAVRVKAKPHRPRREPVPHGFGMAWRAHLGEPVSARELCRAWSVTTGSWAGRPGTREHLTIDARAPEHDYRIAGFKTAHPNAPPGARSGDCLLRLGKAARATEPRLRDEPATVGRPDGSERVGAILGGATASG